MRSHLYNRAVFFNTPLRSHFQSLKQPITDVLHLQLSIPHSIVEQPEPKQPNDATFGELNHYYAVFLFY